MLKISYYTKQKIFHKLINVLMFGLLFLTLFPIGWMIYNSFMNNQNISMGRVDLGRVPHHTVFANKNDQGQFIIGTSDGAINIYDPIKEKIIKRKTFKTFATAIDNFDKDIFIASGDKGLFIYDTINNKTHEINIPWQEHLNETLFVNKIASTILAKDQKGKNIWLTISYANYLTIFEIDLETKKIARVFNISEQLDFAYEKTSISSMLYFQDSLFVGTNHGLIEIDLNQGKAINNYASDIFRDRDIINIRAFNQTEIILADNDNIYIFNKNTKKTDLIYSLKENFDFRAISSIKIKENKIYVGSNQGLLIIDSEGKLLKDINPKIFYEVDQYGHLSGSEISQGDIINIDFINNNELILQSVFGRLAIFDIEKNVLKSTIIIEKFGYIDFRWRNYIDLWNNIDFGLYLRNSFIICISTMIIAMFLATITAYALVRFPFPGSKTVSMAILTTQMIPGILFLIPIYIMFTYFSRITGIQVHGSFWGVIFIYSAFFLPFSIWILRGFFAAIPIALEEAATIDGCNPFQVFTKISLPLAIPGVVATGVFVFLVAWDELMFAWMLTNAQTRTIPVGIRLFVGNFQNRFDLMMAAATVATIPVMIIFFLLQRHIVSGLTSGAVKE